MHFRKDEFESYLRGSSTPNVALESHLKECEPCRGRLAESARSLARTGIPVRENDQRHVERRRERRFDSSGAALVRVIDPFRVEPMPAHICDSSKSGLKVRTGEFLEPGALVLLETSTGYFLGAVRFCVNLDADFFAGIQREEGDPPPTKAGK